MVKTWLVDNNRGTDNKHITFKQINKFLNFCVYGIEKETLRMTKDLRENFALSTVGYELDNYVKIEKDFPVIKAFRYVSSAI